MFKTTKIYFKNVDTRQKKQKKKWTGNVAYQSIECKHIHVFKRIYIYIYEVKSRNFAKKCSMLQMLKLKKYCHYYYED